MYKFKLSILLLIVVFLSIFLFTANNVVAAEGDCHLEHCLVPAPTIFQPTAGATVDGQLNITGLKWKTTIVKVFLDGVELKNIKQIKHEDYYGSFWAWTSDSLKPGRHFVYTIAYSENPGIFDQSKESYYIYFTIAETRKQISKQQPDAEEPKQDELPEATQEQSSVSSETVNVAEQIAPNQVDVQEPGQISGGVSVVGDGIPESAVEPTEQNNEISDLQRTASAGQIKDAFSGADESDILLRTQKRNRVIGLIILIAIIMIGIFSRAKNLKTAFREEVPNVPEQPQDITEQFNWNVTAEEIKIDLPDARAEESCNLQEEQFIPEENLPQEERKQ